MRRPVADPKTLEEAAAIIRAGGVVAIPTDTLYGLAADPFNDAAIARVFEAKGRSSDRALPLIAADAEQVATRLGLLPRMGRKLATEFWPGPLTLIISAPPALPAIVTAGSGKVGVRVPGHPTARALCRACRSPLTATSANVTDHPPTDDPDEVERTIGGRIDLLLDAGRTPGGPPSTVVDVTGEKPQLVRRGAILWEQVLACVDHA
jgi:L-threonylcarbamoyladenylate synthase